MAEVDVGLGRREPELRQDVDILGPRVSAQGLDRGAADHRLGVVERVQDGRAVGLVPRRRLAEEPHRVDSEEAVADGRGGPDLIGTDGAEAEEGPEGMGPGRRREPRERLPEGGDRRRADPVAELVAGPHPDAEVRVIERGDQGLRVGLAEVGRRVERGGFPGVAVVDDAPDPAAELVAAGVVERDLDVADDLVVEVGDVERPVGADLHVDGAEPRVVRDDEVGLLDRLERSSRARGSSRG